MLYKYQNNSRPEVTAFLPQRYFHVLEIGCGTGGFIESLDKSSEVWGVEPNEFAGEQARTKGYRVLSGTYASVHDELPNHHFDLIICNDVIEHMNDPDEFLQAIRQKLQPDGCIVGSIPNVRFCTNLFNLIFKKDWLYTVDGILDSTHLRFFTEKSLRRTFSNNGYSIEQINGINSRLLFWRQTKSYARFFLLLAIIILTLGHSKDIQFVQIGFRIKSQ